MYPHDRSFILVARFTTFNVEPAIPKPKPSYSCATVHVLTPVTTVIICSCLLLCNLPLDLYTLPYDSLI